MQSERYHDADKESNKWLTSDSKSSRIIDKVFLYIRQMVETRVWKSRRIMPNMKMGNAAYVTKLLKP